MSDREHDLVELVKSIRVDLTGVQAKISEALTQLGQLSLTATANRIRCPQCGLDLPGGPKRLANHIYVVHGGPEPEYDDE